jgi:predicted TIM-barrel fold metal-dependent hydrolase
LICHNDAASQCTSIANTDRLDELDAKSSVGTVGDSFDSAMALLVVPFSQSGKEGSNGPRRGLVVVTYAGSRRCNDADSHIMELPDWLALHADPSIRDGLTSISDENLALIAEYSAQRPAWDTPHELLRTHKGWAALGASDPGERSQVLDELGFAKQLVFPTFSFFQFCFSKDLDVFYGGIDAVNRLMAEFCADDERLLPVAMGSLRDAERSVVALERALELGCRAVWMPTSASGGQSPAHVDNDAFWAALEASGVPFVNHVGGGAAILRSAWHENGRDRPTDIFGGGENIRSKDFPSLHHGTTTYLSCLVLDGVFERFPDLRGGSIELGAEWVPGFLRSIDHAANNFGRNEPLLGELTMKPSEYIRRAVKFTPFSFDDVGWIIDNEGPDLFMFSSDYPHPEGGRDPMARFEASLDVRDISSEARTRFYATNFDEFIGDASLVPT